MAGMMPAPSAPPLWRHPEFQRGAREMAGVSMGIAAWGLVTGVAIANSGLPLPLAASLGIAAAFSVAMFILATAFARRR